MRVCIQSLIIFEQIDSLIGIQIGPFRREQDETSSDDAVKRGRERERDSKRMGKGQRESGGGWAGS